MFVYFEYYFCYFTFWQERLLCPDCPHMSQIRLRGISSSVHLSLDVVLVLEMGGVLMAEESVGEDMSYLYWHLDNTLISFQRDTIVSLV